MTSHTASVLPCRQACRPAEESRKSMKANSERRKPSSTRRALGALGVHPWRFAMRLRRLPLAAGRRMLMTVEGADFMAISCVTIVSIVTYRNPLGVVGNLSPGRALPGGQSRAAVPTSFLRITFAEAPSPLAAFLISRAILPPARGRRFLQ